MNLSRRGLLGWALGAVGGAVASDLAPRLGFVDRVAMRLAKRVNAKPTPDDYACINAALIMEVREQSIMQSFVEWH